MRRPTVHVQQRHDWDCGIACLSMATGEDYMDVLATALVVSKHRIIERGMYDEEVVEICRMMGHDAALVPGRLTVLDDVRMILAVPSLNRLGVYHFVYWDGSEIYDPQQGRPGRLVYAKKPPSLSAVDSAVLVLKIQKEEVG